MGNSDKSKKSTISTKSKKDSNPTLREQWNKSGASADIRKTTEIINAICDKIELK